MLKHSSRFFFEYILVYYCCEKKNIPLTVYSGLYGVDNYFGNPSDYLFVRFFFFSAPPYLRTFVMKNIIKKM